MTTIRVDLTSALAPQQVLEAAHDFSARRAKVFPAVSTERLDVHESGEAWADVTEATKVGPFGDNWERCRYDWSAPGSVTADVTDSNVYAPAGSSWTIAATPDAGGSRIEMTWERKFRGNLRGVVFGTAFRLVGKPIFRRYARDILANIEALYAA